MGRPGRLAEEHRRALARLIGLSGIDRFYLVGGTAIAYHLGHRVSEDLDLFSIRGRVDPWEEIKRFFLREAPRLLDSFRTSALEE